MGYEVGWSVSGGGTYGSLSIGVATSINYGPTDVTMKYPFAYECICK